MIVAIPFAVNQRIGHHGVHRPRLHTALTTGRKEAVIALIEVLAPLLSEPLLECDWCEIRDVLGFLAVLAHQRRSRGIPVCLHLAARTLRFQHQILRAPLGHLASTK